MAKRLAAKGKGRSKKGGKKGGDLKKVLRMTPRDTLANLMRDALRLDKNKAEVGVKHAKAIRAAVEGKNLHVRTFNTIKRELKAESNKPGSLAVFLAHFDHHREALRLDDVASKQGDMFEVDVSSGTESPKVVPIKPESAAGGA